MPNGCAVMYAKKTSSVVSLSPITSIKNTERKNALKMTDVRLLTISSATAEKRRVRYVFRCCPAVYVYVVYSASEVTT